MKARVKEQNPSNSVQAIEPCTVVFLVSIFRIDGVWCRLCQR
jgi:hypothetical protein